MGNFMKSLKFITVLILLASLYAFAPEIYYIKKAVQSDKVKCGFYINKRTNDLFQVRSSLSLKCDSTFIFLSNSCLLDEKSSGTWTLKNDSIYLTPDKKTVKLIIKGKLDFVDRNVQLSNNILITKGSVLVWQHSENYIDTFQEAMTIKYNNY